MTIPPTVPHSSEPNAVAMAAFVGALVAGGVTDAVVSPGSRSTPLTLALLARDDVRTQVVIDERSASFCALGIARRSGRPVVVVATSGTAPAHWHPAALEATASGVGLILCSADRPPEAHGRGAAQTVDQTDLFGRGGAVLYVDAGPPDGRVGEAAWFRHLGARVAEAAATPGAGAVQVNLGFRDPLAAVAAPDHTPGPKVHRSAPAEPDATAVTALATRLATHRHGLLVAGAPVDDSPTAGADVGVALARLAALCGWPIIDEVTSGVRFATAAAAHCVAHPELAVRIVAAAGDAGPTLPSAVVRVGGWPIAKPIAAYLTEAAAQPDHLHLHLAPAGWSDPADVVTDVVRADPAAGLHALAEALGSAGAGHVSPDPAWTQHWHAAAAHAADVWSARRDSPDLLEPATAAAVLDALPDSATLWLSASMPLRDCDTFCAPVADRRVRVLANRGANGIDGLIAAATGAAIADHTDATSPTVLLCGDVAFAHDAASLGLAAAARAPLTVVVVDNGGGGIFAFLPQASLGLGESFTRGWLTPPPFDAHAAAQMAGIEYRAASDLAGLRDALGDLATRTAPAVIHVRTGGIDANVAAHRDLYAALTRTSG